MTDAASKTGHSGQPTTCTLPDGEYTIVCLNGAFTWGLFDDVPHDGTLNCTKLPTESPSQRWTLKNTANGFTLQNVANPTYYATSIESTGSVRDGPFQIVQTNTTATFWQLQPAAYNAAYQILPTNNLNYVVVQSVNIPWVVLASPDVAIAIPAAMYWYFARVADTK